MPRISHQKYTDKDVILPPMDGVLKQIEKPENQYVPPMGDGKRIPPEIIALDDHLRQRMVDDGLMSTLEHSGTVFQAMIPDRMREVRGGVPLKGMDRKRTIEVTSRDDWKNWTITVKAPGVKIDAPFFINRVILNAFVFLLKSYRVQTGDERRERIRPLVYGDTEPDLTDDVLTHVLWRIRRLCVPPAQDLFRYLRTEWEKAIKGNDVSGHLDKRRQVFRNHLRTLVVGDGMLEEDYFDRHVNANIVFNLVWVCVGVSIYPSGVYSHFVTTPHDVPDIPDPQTWGEFKDHAGTVTGVLALEDTDDEEEEKESEPPLSADAKAICAAIDRFREETVKAVKYQGRRYDRYIKTLHSTMVFLSGNPGSTVAELKDRIRKDLDEEENPESEG